MTHRIVIIALAVLLIAPQLFAERQNRLSTQIAATAGLDDNPRVGIGNSPQLEKLSPVYGFFPSITVDSTGANSFFEFTYGFGYQYVKETLIKDFYHHSFGLSLETQATRNLTFSLNERFITSPEFTTTNLFQGIVFTPEGVFFDYETVVVDRNSFANTIHGDIDYRVGDRSALEFRVGHSMRRYDNVAVFSGRLSDQDRVNGRFAFRSDISSHSSWDLAYTVFYNDFKEYSNALTHGAGAGYSHQFGPSVDLRLEAGPSYIQSEQSDLDYWSWYAAFRISKSFEENYVSLFYERRPGVSTGIGSISETDRVGFNFNRPLGRRTTVSAGLSLYDQRRRLDNPVDLRGYQVSARLQFLLTDNWALGVGGDFRRQDEDTELLEDRFFDYDRRRIYVTLTFLLPELVRF